MHVVDVKALRAAIVGLVVAVAGCELEDPVVVVANRTSEHLQLRNLSINGCVWETVLAYGQNTTPMHCMPGDDQVHFSLFDARDYCRREIDAGRPCESADASVATGVDGGGPVIPVWYNFQTVARYHLAEGDFRVIDVTDAIEQDFSIPGPFGH